MQTPAHAIGFVSVFLKMELQATITIPFSARGEMIMDMDVSQLWMYTECQLQ